MGRVYRVGSVCRVGSLGGLVLRYVGSWCPHKLGINAALRFPGCTPNDSHQRCCSWVVGFLPCVACGRWGLGVSRGSLNQVSTRHLSWGSSVAGPKFDQSDCRLGRLLFGLGRCSVFSAPLLSAGTFRVPGVTWRIASGPGQVALLPNAEPEQRNIAQVHASNAFLRATIRVIEFGPAMEDTPS